MIDKLKSLARAAMDTVSSTAVLIGDLNGDGKVDEEDARIAADWTKKTATSLYDEVSQLGKEAIRSDIAKDAASCAVIGAVVAIPVPIIGPIAGAAIGAGLGVYKNFTKKGQPVPVIMNHASVPKDVHAELLKSYDLMQKNIISEVEFQAQKKKLLSTST